NCVNDRFQNCLLKLLTIDFHQLMGKERTNREQSAVNLQSILETASRKKTSEPHTAPSPTFLKAPAWDNSP
ncbi:hypothetical protein TNIN_275291, partial [Trichonephila inaurata madagascariensis]